MKLKSLGLASILLVACGDSSSQEASSVETAKKQPDNSIAVLQYHHVSETTPAVTSITPKQFKQHLDYLEENEFSVLSIEQAHQRIENDEGFPDKAVVITFDDGYDNVFEHAAPLLADYDMPYAVFVNPDLMKESPSAYMSWEQLKQIQQQGATIVNHGQTHAHLIRRRANETEEQWRERMHYDVISAQQVIDAKLGEQSKYFAYPYGEYDAELQNLLDEWGFLGFAQHSGPWSPYSDKTAITRFPASGIYANLKTLDAKLKSRALPVADYKPSEPLIAYDDERPTLRVTLAHTDGLQQKALRCFQGTDVLQPSWQDELTFSVKPKENLPIGRSRINCTAPADAGSPYYWFSAAFIRPDAEGSWPD